jgi:hypothetical protein
MERGMHRLILASWCLLTCIACGGERAGSRVPLPPGVEFVGRIADRGIRESSGIAASRQHNQVFWTHNDRGNAQVLYAIRRTGESIAQFLVTGARFEDWEDIAADEHGHLFLGDIGNNERQRLELAVHQVAEPDPESAAREAPILRSWRLRYRAKPFDCESLFILGGHGYLISKVTQDARARIYRFALAAGESQEPVMLEFVAETSITSPVTGADVSRDGSLLGIVGKAGAWIYRIDGDVSRVAHTRPQRTRFQGHQIEACTFVPEGLLATSESREIYLFLPR